MCFSATIPASLQDVLQSALKPRYTNVDCTGGDEGDTHDPSKVPQSYILSSLEDMNRRVCELITSELVANPKDFKVIVFLPTARQAQFISELLDKWTNGPSLPFGKKIDVLEIHSRKSMGHRTKVSAKFRTASNGLLVSSDVSARGVDYPDVSFVLQVGLPASREQYVHRLGRTGRAGKSGRGVLLLHDFEQSFLKNLKDFNVKAEPTPTLPDTVGLESVEKAVNSVPSLTKEQTYQAWLGYYNSNTYLFNRDKSVLVQTANHMSQVQLGLREPPELLKKTIGKMGLKGVPGIRIGKPKPRQ